MLYMVFFVLFCFKNNSLICSVFHFGLKFLVSIHHLKGWKELRGIDFNMDTGLGSEFFSILSGVVPAESELSKYGFVSSHVSKGLCSESRWWVGDELGVLDSLLCPQQEALGNDTEQL